MSGVLTHTIEMGILAAARTLHSSLTAQDITEYKKFTSNGQKGNSDYILSAPGQGRHFLFSFMVEAPTTGRLSGEKHIDCLSLKQAWRA